MYTIKSTASFDSAHFLYGYNGKCANLHGHRWLVEAVLAAETLPEEGPERGMLVDFGCLKAALKELADGYDHALIYEEGTLKGKTVEALLEEGFRLLPVPFRPTAEHFACSFYQELKKQGLPVKSVTVYETPENGASYQED